MQQFEDKDAAVEEATEIVHAMPAADRGRLAEAVRGQDRDRRASRVRRRRLIEDLLGLMQTDGADFTNTFRPWAARMRAISSPIVMPLMRGPLNGSAHVSRPRPIARAVMRAANPAVIPRNHRIEQMIEAAVAGDMAPFERLMTALANAVQ